MADRPTIEVPITIRRDGGSPLYVQVAEQLRAAVDSGLLRPGDPFENEVALAERLGLSRPTIRRAIAELVGQGLLLRRRGAGTIVANRQIHRRAELSSLYDDLTRAGETPHTQVLDLNTVTDPRAATALGLDESTPLWCLHRLRTAGGRPFALMTNWVPVTALPDADADALSDRGLYALLRERGIRPVVARQSIGARRADAAERRLLELGRTDPVLTMTRAAFDAAGIPVEFGDHIYRADSYTIDVTLDDR